MENAEAFIFRNVEFDGCVYVKVMGLSPDQSCMVTLYKEGQVLRSLSGQVVMFDNQQAGRYQAEVNYTGGAGVSGLLKTREITISAVGKTLPSTVKPTTKSTPEVFSPVKGVTRYYLQIKLDHDDSLARLKQGALTQSPLFSRVRGRATYEKLPNNKLLGDIIPRTYYVDPGCTFDELVAIVTELEQLDYVVYCTVVPDTTGMAAPDLPPRETPSSLTLAPHVTEPTPLFQSLQTYLGDGVSSSQLGMNVLEAWGIGEYGKAATVRHLDFGVYRNHEDLRNNITVVSSRPETEDCNHGTASTGCIAASKNTIGVVGIAHGCHFNFYDTGSLDLIIRDAVPGDIVSLDIQLQGPSNFLPMVHNRSWWDKIKSLVDKGVVVIMAAGNGGLDLSVQAGNMNQFRDSGGFLAGACYHTNGRKVYFSNYKYAGATINSWGDWSVVTTGYGSLQKMEGNNRNYSKDYSGTSSATPLCAGALALIQSYMITHFGTFLNASWMRHVLSVTGYNEGSADAIGRRPNVMAALRFVRTHFA